MRASDQRQEATCSRRYAGSTSTPLSGSRWRHLIAGDAVRSVSISQKLFADSAYQGPIFANALAKFLPRLETPKSSNDPTMRKGSYNYPSAGSSNVRLRGSIVAAASPRIGKSNCNARALQLRFSQSLARRRRLLSHAIVRSTIQRLGNCTNPFGMVGSFDDFGFETREEFGERVSENRPLVRAVGK